MPMWWSKALDQGPLGPGPLADWGKCTCYLEVGDDGFAFRQVYAFESGRLLCWDRTHWADGFGFLGDARLGKKKPRKSRWIVVAIDVVEFEEVWTNARASEDWK